jgi:hypothetical protein
VYGAPPASWQGSCQAGEGFSVANCNNKLIGARYYRASTRPCTGPSSVRRAIPWPARRATAAMAPHGEHGRRQQWHAGHVEWRSKLPAWRRARASPPIRSAGRPPDGRRTAAPRPTAWPPSTRR